MYQSTVNFSDILDEYIFLLETTPNENQVTDRFYQNDENGVKYNVMGLYIKAVCNLNQWGMDKFYNFLKDLKLSESFEGDATLKKYIPLMYQFLKIMQLSNNISPDDDNIVDFQEVGNNIKEFLEICPKFRKELKSMERFLEDYEIFEDEVETN